MNTKERILAIRLLEKIIKHPTCAQALGIQGAGGLRPDAEKFGK